MSEEVRHKGFPNEETWLVYDYTVHNAELLSAVRAVVDSDRYERMANACDALEDVLHWHLLREEVSASDELANELIRTALARVKYEHLIRTLDEGPFEPLPPQHPHACVVISTQVLDKNAPV